MNTSKLDLRKKLRHLYSGKAGTIQMVQPGIHQFLCYDGEGDPNVSPEYQRAVEALFAVSYQIKFDARKSLAIDYAVMPLEGLWWSEDPDDFTGGKKAKWKWTMMILQPPFITSGLVISAKSTIERKRHTDLQRLNFREHAENACAQTLHVGPYTEEAPVIAAIHAWIRAGNHQLDGMHHEIYLTDNRRSSPERWKTIIRQPYH
jgi:hypothetical protein